MTAGISAAQANSFLTSLTTGTFVKLHTGDPGASGTNNAAVETTRKAVTWGAASAGAIQNQTDILWDDAAATETITHVSLWDAASGGTFRDSVALSESVAVTEGDSIEILAGEIDIVLTPIAA